MNTVQARTDPRIADLKQAGKIRVYIRRSMPNIKAAICADGLLNWLAHWQSRLGLSSRPSNIERLPKAMEAFKTGVCDVGFGAMHELQT